MLLGYRSSSLETGFPFPEFTPRGIDAVALLAQLRLTTPFLFDRDFGGISPEESRPYLDALVGAQDQPERALGLADYFRLCLSAHWASVASFAPIEAEGLIRYKLWQSAVSTDVIHEMSETVLESYRWDFTAVSRKWMVSPHSGLRLSSHHGEWFAIAVAAYAATRERDPFLALRIREAIEFEVTREAKIYLETRKAKDGVGLLLASSLIAHNLSTLDRAIETWRLGTEDPLFEFAYRAAYAVGARAARFGGALTEAGRVNKTFMAAENHRHFALRIPRALRRSPDYLLPLAPFLDDWGNNLANHPGLSLADLGEIVETLYSAWEKLKGGEGAILTHAYPRAVAGILTGTPFGVSALTPFLSPSVDRNLRSGLFHSLISVPKARFHEQWGAQALGSLR